MTLFHDCLTFPEQWVGHEMAGLAILWSAFGPWSVLGHGLLWSSVGSYAAS
jgi:hypothetical protein